jgi:Zn-dependent M28 family amino/carboxypeptidase
MDSSSYARRWIGPARWVVLALLAAGCGPEIERAAGALPEISGEEIARHTRALSSDEFLGRGPGQAGGRMAADYVAAGFRAAGLEAIEGSFRQPFEMIGYRPDPARVSLSFDRSGARVEARYLEDFVLNPGDPGAASVSGRAELVFVGYGIDAPESGWDDFRGVDVRGKWLLMLVSDPPAPPSEPELFGGPAMTYYGRWTYKYEEAARKGAVGALIVHETAEASYPWSVVRSSFANEQFALPPVEEGPAPPAMIGWVTVDLARRILASGGYDFDELKATAAVRGFTAVPTGVTVAGRVESAVRTVETENVAGILRGTERPDEAIVVTAHYDHLGIGEPVDGDSIYNGAVDNAGGVGLLMAMATAMAGAHSRPERSIVFVATGAEEQGLLGAQWYVGHPLVPLRHTVAAFNFDGVNLWGLTADVTVLGEGRSELRAYVHRRAEEMGLEVAPDPRPASGSFFRSDHLAFARAGVPALFLERGLSYVGRADGWGDSIAAAYSAERYHAPSDEWSEDFVFDGAVQQGTLGMLTILDLAASDDWPRWYEGQEFKAARDSVMARP